MDASPLLREDMAKTIEKYPVDRTITVPGESCILLHGHTHCVVAWEFHPLPLNLLISFAFYLKTSYLNQKISSSIQPVAICGLLVMQVHMRESELKITLCFFTRVKDAQSIKHLFCLRKQLHHFLSKHIFQKRSTDNTVIVFCGHGTSILKHKTMHLFH